MDALNARLILDLHVLR